MRKLKKRLTPLIAISIIGLILAGIILVLPREIITEQEALAIAAKATYPNGESIFAQDPGTLRRCTSEFATIEDPCVSVEYSKFEGKAQWHVFVGCGSLCGNGIIINAITGTVEGFSVS